MVPHTAPPGETSSTPCYDTARPPAGKRRAPRTRPADITTNSPYPPYPRPSYYSNKLSHFVRRIRRRQPGELDATGLTQAAYILVATIASIEDEAHRPGKTQGPVLCWRETLAAECGVSIPTLERARKRAVAAGWLCHFPGSRKRAGGYATTVPADLREEFAAYLAGARRSDGSGGGESQAHQADGPSASKGHQFDGPAPGQTYHIDGPSRSAVLD